MLSRMDEKTEGQTCRGTDEAKTDNGHDANGKHGCKLLHVQNKPGIYVHMQAYRCTHMQTHMYTSVNVVMILMG